MKRGYSEHPQVETSLHKGSKVATCYQAASASTTAPYRVQNLKENVHFGPVRPESFACGGLREAPAAQENAKTCFPCGTSSCATLSDDDSALETSAFERAERIATCQPHVQDVGSPISNVYGSYEMGDSAMYVLKGIEDMLHTEVKFFSMIRKDGERMCVQYGCASPMRPAL